MEVLRGPQGTLYGASSLGGLIKYVTVPPSLTAFGGRIQADYSAVDGGGSVGAVVERELLDWIAEAEVGQVKMTMLSKASGEWKRYGVTVAVQRIVDQDS